MRRHITTFCAVALSALCLCALERIGKVELVSADLSKRAATVAWTWTEIADSAVRLSLSRNGDDFPTAGWGGTLFIGDGTLGCAVSGVTNGYNELMFDVGRDSIPTNGKYTVQILATNETGRVEEWARGTLTVRANPAADGMPASWSLYQELARKVAPFIDAEGILTDPDNAAALWGAVAGRTAGEVSNVVTKAYVEGLGAVPADYANVSNRAMSALQEHQDISGKADKADTYTKAQTDTRIVELAPPPADYETVSNKAMSALQSHQSLADYYTKAQTEAKIQEISPRTSLEPATNYTDKAIGDFAGTGTVYWATGAAGANVAQKANALDDGEGDERTAAQIFGKLDAATTTGGVSNIVTKAYVEGLGIEAGITAETATNISKGAVAHVDTYLSAKDVRYGVPDGDTVILFADGGRTNVSWSGTLSEQNLIDAGIMSNQWGLIIRPAVAIYGGTNVTGIGSAVFDGFPILKTVVFPCVTDIGDNSFSSCSALETIDFPKVSTLVSTQPFYECTALKNISMPSLSVLGDAAFGACTSLVSVELTNLVEIADGGWNGGPFNDCTKLESIYMPRLTNIADYAFWGCHSLREVNFGNTLGVVAALGDDVFAETPQTMRIIVPDTMYDEWKEYIRWWEAYLSQIVKYSDWRYAHLCDVVKEESDPVWLDEKAEYAKTGAVAAVSSVVNAWEGYWSGTNVIFEVTNYYGNSSGELPRLRVKEFRDGAWQTVWDEANKFTVCETNILTNVVQIIRQEGENYAPKAWGTVTDKGTPNVVGNSVWMTSPETYFAGGTEYQRVAVGSGTICVLTDNGAGTYTAGEAGTFRFQDEGGTNYFGFAKSESYTIGCKTDGIAVDGSLVTLRYDVIMGGTDVPIVYWRLSLSGGEWVQLNNSDGTATAGAPYTVTWYTSGGSYYAAINCGDNASGFFKAETSVAGDVVFETNMKARLGGGIECKNTQTGTMGVIRPTYNGSAVSWTWSAK